MSREEDLRKQRVRQAVRELLKLNREEAEDLLLELLQKAEAGEIELRDLLGYSLEDFYGLYEKAHFLYINGRIQNALGICLGILAMSPGLVPVQLLRASCLLEMKHYPEALEILDWASEIEPYNLEIHIKRAHVLYRVGAMDDVVALLKWIVEMDPQQETRQSREAQIILLGILESSSA